MSRQTIKKTVSGFVVVVALLAIGVAAGLWWERRQAPGGGMETSAVAAPGGPAVLYLSR